MCSERATRDRDTCLCVKRFPASLERRPCPVATAVPSERLRESFAFAGCLASQPGIRIFLTHQVPFVTKAPAERRKLSVYQSPVEIVPGPKDLGPVPIL